MAIAKPTRTILTHRDRESVQHTVKSPYVQAALQQAHARLAPGPIAAISHENPESLILPAEKALPRIGCLSLPSPRL